MKMNIQGMVAQYGFALLREFSTNLNTLDAMTSIGGVIQAVPLPVVQTLRPKVTADPNTYSGNYGVGAFPLHTDLAHWAIPPRYLGLRCVVGSPGVFTTVFDGMELIEHFGRDQLQRTLVQPRRLLENRRSLLRVLSESALDWSLRWDDVYLVPATPLSAVTVAKIQAFLRAVAVHNFELVSLGDTLIIDNWRMLHGRSSVGSSGKARHLERIYLGELHG